MILTQKHKILGTALLTSMVFFLGKDLFIPHALAAPLLGNDYVQQIAEKLEIFHQFFSPLINFFATHIGNFLGNDYIFAGTMGEMLKNLWVISRNLVNIFFVGALLWVALKAVAGDFFGEETDLKKELLKIAIFLVVVNFSWLITKVVLDASNVATNIVFSLPTGVSNVANIDLGDCTINDETGLVEGSCKPSASYFGANADLKNTQNLTTEECKKQKIKEAYAKSFPDALDKNFDPVNGDPELANKSTFCWDKLDLFDYNQNTAVVYLTYGMANIQNLGASHSQTNNFAKMALASLFSLLIQITYTVALMALFILMVIRMAILWLFVGFSPALVAVLYLGGSEGPVANFGPKDFIKWAFVPAYTGIILSAGFIMIAAGRANSEILTNLNQNVNLDAAFYNPISIFSGIDSTFNLIWLIVVELVFAIGVYAPMKELPFAGTIIGPIADFAKTTLTSLAKAPLLAPIVPVTDSSGGRTYRSFRDLNLAFQSKLQFREGAAGDVENIKKMEKEVEEFNAKFSERDKATQIQTIIEEAKRNETGTLGRHFTLPTLKDMDEDQQNDVFEGIGITKKDERDLIINAMKRSPLTASTPAVAPAPAPAPGSAEPAEPEQPTETKTDTSASAAGGGGG